MFHRNTVLEIISFGHLYYIDGPVHSYGLCLQVQNKLGA